MDKPVSEVWGHVRNLAFDKLLPDFVTKVEFLEGHAGQVGAVLFRNFHLKGC